MSWTDSRREVLYHDETPRLRQVLKCRRQIFGFGLGTSVLLALVLLYQSINTDETARVRDRPISYGLPGHLAGVNLGGWLCLEDWFYSGDRGLHVSTVSEHGQGRCLPPAVSNTPWDSEGNLTFQLNQTRGRFTNLGKTILRCPL